MRGSDFMELRAFELVARNLSFSKAAQDIGMSRAALSHIVKNLETRLGISLLRRTTRSVALTDAGRELLERLSPALHGLVNAVENVDRFRLQPAGRVRILCSRLAAALYLDAIFPSFAMAQPDVALDIHVSDAPGDHVSLGFDAAIQAEGQLDRDMIGLKLADGCDQILVASPAYLHSAGHPIQPSDLEHHRCLIVGPNPGQRNACWELLKDNRSASVEISGPLSINDHDLAMNAAIRGMGIALLPEPLVALPIAESKLARVLHGYAGREPAMYLCYTKQANPTLAFRSFIGFVSEYRKSSLLNM
ncbi:LysR family transcriptional regulator [Flavisphingomonas formosensis]|uniref:LysR family transcriptional regulator n=1 Tax=Flavisphingomonas formosensis TaxID=861534 RepID=UPI0012F7C244|nr:LysR family transcriptional regulator [Sphingomonas formosensis]